MADPITDITSDNDISKEELNVLNNIFKSKSKITIEQKKEGTFSSTLLGALLSTILAVPFISSLISKLGGDSIFVKLAVNFVLFAVLFFLLRKQFKV